MTDPRIIAEIDHAAALHWAIELLRLGYANAPTEQLCRAYLDLDTKVASLLAVAEASDAEVKRLREALEQTDNSRLSAYELAEGTFYEMEALKMGVRKFFDVIKTNIVNSPAFPEDMRFMAKMLLVNNEALLREAESGTLQLSQNPDRLGAVYTLTKIEPEALDKKVGTL